MWSVVEVGQLTEGSIHGDQDPARAARALEACRVSRIGPELPRLNNVAARPPKSVAEVPAGAAVNEEFQTAATETAANGSRGLTRRGHRDNVGGEPQ